MPTRLYLDTARLGLMAASVQRVQHDFVRLAGEEAGTLYFERLLKHGFASWPAVLQNRYPALAGWHGVGHLKNQIRLITGASPGSHVLVANRSTELMRLAARLLCERCSSILTTDLSWPNYQRILRREARLRDTEIICLPIRRLLLRNRIDSERLIAMLTDALLRHRCDGLFLPAVDNLGVRLPIREIVQALRRRSKLNLVVVDGAQAVGHIPLSLADVDCDLFLTGCHKWLRAYYPLGFAVFGRRIACSMNNDVDKLLGKYRIDDPLTRFTSELETGCLTRYGETVNLLPLFTCPDYS